MERGIKWSSQAFEDLSQVLTYLEEEWHHAIAVGFRKKLNEGISYIQAFPEVGSTYVDNPSVRKILVTKHNALYYEFNESEIVILRIVDTRSDEY